MIKIIKSNPNTWKRKCWIAKKIGYDVENNINIYDKPVLYEFNIQPISTEADLVEFGERASSIMKAIIPISYEGVFKEFDVAYIGNANPVEEKVNGAKANYVLKPPRNQNSVIQIYFEKITGK